MLALGATGGLGGGLGLSLTEGVDLGGGGLGAGTGVTDRTVSWSDCVFGVAEGLSVVLQGWGSRVGAEFGAEAV